jgi:membrane protein YqaA with SNARE-associated domain
MRVANPHQQRRRLGFEVLAALVVKTLALVLLALVCFSAAQRLHVTPETAFHHIASDQG